MSSIYPTPISSSAVKDKVSAMLICRHIPNSDTTKSGRSGEKYLASQELNHDLSSMLLAGIKYKATGKVDGTCTLVQGGVMLKRRDIKQQKGPDDKKKQVIPANWIQTGADVEDVAPGVNIPGNVPRHLIGFMPLDKGDKWHIDCHVKTATGYCMDMINLLDLNDDKTGLEYKQVPVTSLDNHSVEVMGPKFQTNPHHLSMHCVMRHGLIELRDFPDLTEYANSESEAKNVEEDETTYTGTGTRSGTQPDPRSAIKNWFIHSPQGKFLEGVVLHLENGQMFKIHRHHLDLEWTADGTPPLDQIPL